MKQVISLAKFEEWRVLARQYPLLDDIIREQFLDSVQYLELQVKHRSMILISRLEIIGCSYTKWFVDDKTYYIYHHMREPTGIDTPDRIKVQNDAENTPSVVKTASKRPRKLPKTDDSNNK